jgi:predicted transcriptional regulator of viral defense system
MKQKDLADIKHGQAVVSRMQGNGLFFVEDIRRVTGLDDKLLRATLLRLLKNGYLAKNDNGQWFTPDL